MRNLVSIDTVKLHLTNYELDANPNLIIEGENVNLNTGEIAGGLIYNGENCQIIGQKAYHNAPNFNLTLTRYGLFAQFSAPKIIHGENTQGVYCKTEFIEALNIVESKLNAIGVRANLHEATLTRLDLFRQAELPNLCASYTPIFEQLTLPNCVKSITNGTLLIRNKTLQYCLYDKEKEAGERGGRKFTPSSNLMRCEIRAINSKAVKSKFHLRAITDVLSHFDKLDTIYKANVRKLLRQPQGTSKAVNLLNLEKIMQAAKNESGKFGLHEVKKALQEIGLTYLSEKNQLNTFKEIALNSTEQSGANLRNSRNKLNALTRCENLLNSAQFIDLYSHLYTAFAA